MKFTANLLVTSPPGRFSGDVRNKGPARGPFFQLPASEDGGAFGRTT